MPPASPSSPSAPTPLWHRMLPWLALVCAALAIASTSRWIGLQELRFVCKPLATLMIMVYAWRLPDDGTARKRWILAGLGFSVLGDAALAWPGGFLLGLALFLVTQLCYLAAFRVNIGFGRMWQPYALHGVAVGAMMYLWSGAPQAVVLPAFVYLAALGLMSAQSDAWWWRTRGTPDEARARRAAIGGLLFVTADIVIAVSQFVSWIPGTYLWAMGTYWAAQWLIASSFSPAAQPVAAASVRTPDGLLPVAKPKTKADAVDTAAAPL